MGIKYVYFLVRSFRRPDLIVKVLDNLGGICNGLGDSGIVGSPIVVIDENLDIGFGTAEVVTDHGCDTIVSYRNPQVIRSGQEPKLSMGFYGLLNAGMTAAAQNRIIKGAVDPRDFDDTIVFSVSQETGISLEAVLKAIEFFNADSNALAVGLSLIGGQAETNGFQPGYQPWNAGTAWHLGLFFKYVGGYALMHEKLGWQITPPHGKPVEVSGTEDLGTFMRVFKSFPFLHVYLLRSMPIDWQVATGATDVSGEDKMWRKNRMAEFWAKWLDVDLDAWMNWIVRV